MTNAQIHPSLAKDLLSGILICLGTILLHHLVPLIGVFIWILLPLPITFYRLKVGRKAGMIIAAVPLTLFIAINGNPIAFVMYYGFFLMAGFILGECIEKLMGIERTVLYTVFFLTFIMGAFIFISAQATGQEITQLAGQFIEGYKASSHKFFSQVIKAYPEAQLDINQLEATNAVFIKLFPAIWFIALVNMVWLNILYIKRILKRNGIVINTLENLDHWKSPDILIAGLILSGIGLFIPVDTIQWCAMNGLFVLMFVYFLQGLAIASYFFSEKKTPAVVRFFFYVFALLQPLFTCLVIAFGLFDNWFNFRKLDAAK